MHYTTVSADELAARVDANPGRGRMRDHHNAGEVVEVTGRPARWGRVWATGRPGDKHVRRLIPEVAYPDGSVYPIVDKHRIAALKKLVGTDAARDGGYRVLLNKFHPEHTNRVRAGGTKKNPTYRRVPCAGRICPERRRHVIGLAA